MRRSIGCWLGGSLLFAAAGAGAVPVAWVSPPAGAVWKAGESVTLEWRRTGSWPAGLEVEEWEAFLSLDGGRSFTVRLTPHLDAGLRAVRITVPNLPTAQARVLLRFGDERRETEWAVPGEFTIRGAASASGSTDLAFQGVPTAAARGEAARPGDSGVVLWAEGRRDGGDWRVATAAPAALWRSSVEPGRAGAEAAASAESSSLEVDSRRPQRISNVAARVPRHFAPRFPRRIPILRLIERLNE